MNIVIAIYRDYQYIESSTSFSGFSGAVEVLGDHRPAGRQEAWQEPRRLWHLGWPELPGARASGAVGLSR